MRNIIDHHFLIISLIRREITMRYRGSVLGLLWSFMQPIFMLLMYVFVFGFVFKIRWGTGDDNSGVEFGIVLFSGLLLHSLLSDCLLRSTNIIVANQQYVKKVVFPLQIFPLVILGTALFYLSIGILILLLFQLFLTWHIPWTVVLMPIVIAPLAIFCWGIAAKE